MKKGCSRIAGGRIREGRLIPVPAEGPVLPGFVYEDLPFQEFLLVEHRNGLLGFRQVDISISESPGLWPIDVLFAGLRLPPLRNGFQICFGGLGRKVADINLRIHTFLPFPAIVQGEPLGPTGKKTGRIPRSKCGSGG
jgi:hypothetical protein